MTAARRASLARLIAVGIVVTTASGAGQRAEAAAGPEPLRILNSFKAEAIDPAKPGAHWCYEFAYCEYPMQAADEGGLEPWLLSSLDPVDELTWRLTVRPGITFQNGRPVDGEALAASLQRQIDLFAQVTPFLPGATAEAAGAREVLLRTSKPTAIVPALLAERSLFPVYDVAAVERVLAGGEDRDLAGAGIFTAPYAVTELTADRLTLERYDGYWAGMPALPGIEVRFVTDPQARILAVQNGEADIALYPPSEVQDTLAGRDDIFLRRQEVAQETLRLAPNVGQPPLDELAVRRAAALAVDYEALAQDVMGGLYDVAQGMYPSDHDYSLVTQRTDPAEAERILDEAGWVEGAGGVRARDGQPLQLILLTYPQQPDTATHAVAVQDQLGRVGFDVSIRQVEDVNATITEEPWVPPPGSPVAFGCACIPARGVAPRLHSLAAMRARRALRAGRNRTLDADRPSGWEHQGWDIAVIFNGTLSLTADLKPFPVVVGPAYQGYEVSPVRRLVTYQTAPAS